MYKFKKIIETDAHDGACWVPAKNRFYYTTLPELDRGIPSALCYLDLNTQQVYSVLQPSNMGNGICLGCCGDALLIAEQGMYEQPGCISQLNLSDNKRTVLVDHYRNLPFNSPNKVVQNRQGHLFFTDPDYGYYQQFKPKPSLPAAVYRFDPKTQDTICLTDQLAMPHGIALSKNEKVLYVVDNGPAVDKEILFHRDRPQLIYKLVLNDAGAVISMHEFIIVEPPVYIDGIVVDDNDLLFLTNLNSILVFNSMGELLEKVVLDSNDKCWFINLAVVGDAFYITADDSIYKLYQT